MPLVRDAIRSIDLEARRIDVDLEFLGERLTSSRCSRSGSTGSATQRHVENALALGHTRRGGRPAGDDAAEVGPGRRHAVRRRGGDGAARRRGRGGAAGPLRRSTRSTLRRAAPRDRADAGRPAARRRARRQSWRGEEALTLLCGRYEGFDERILEHFCTEQLSIGRYVLAGGELAAMVVLDTVLRKLPGALGDDGVGASRSRSPRRWTARPSTRTTRGRPTGAAGRFPRCCSRATTRGSREWRLRAGASAGLERVRYHDRRSA